MSLPQALQLSSKRRPLLPRKPPAALPRLLPLPDCKYSAQCEPSIQPDALCHLTAPLLTRVVQLASVSRCHSCKNLSMSAAKRDSAWRMPSLCYHKLSQAVNNRLLKCFPRELDLGYKVLRSWRSAPLPPRPRPRPCPRPRPRLRLPPSRSRAHHACHSRCHRRCPGPDVHLR